MDEIDTYLAGVPEPERAALNHIRQLVHQAVPDAVEVVSYGMPGFKYRGMYLCGFNAFKDHLSFFPTTIPDEFIRELRGFKLSRGTIQFKHDQPIPDDIITKLLRHRVAAITTSNR